MVGLVDIAPSIAKVAIGGSQVDVPGVSARGIATLFQRFPELQRMVKLQDLQADKLLEMSDDLIAAILAAGCGYPGDADQEAAAARLSLEDKATLLEAIIKVTLPNGLTPFVEKISALGDIISGGHSALAQASKSPGPSSS